MEDRNFDQDTDLVIAIVKDNSERQAAEARARFEIAIEAEAAKYRSYRKAIRSRFHVLSQISLVLMGMCGLVTAVFCFTGGGWWCIVSLFATFCCWMFSNWCDHKSFKRRGEE